MRNALTIDVEDYFQVSAMAPHIRKDDWPLLPARIERNIARLLAVLAEQQVAATFFTLGWIAERYPQMVRTIVAAGHELASHGYDHQRASAQTPQQFAVDVRRARQILEQTAACPVRGYRAPSFSIGDANRWAWQVLAEAGYHYSSSVYPIRHDHYGMPDGERHAWRPERSAALLELPISTVRLAQRNFPAGGGGYFRLLPYALSRWAITHINEREQRSAIFYLHPWEIDPGQPRIPGLGWKTRFRHYVNLQRTETRLQCLLRDFTWDRMDRIFLEPQR